MSICQSGIKSNLSGQQISIQVKDTHPLIRLGKLLDWPLLCELVLPDLKATGGKWWLGRKLKVRIHLGVYLLQQLFNKTDRQIEYDVKDNAAYQIFCGLGVVKNWHAPDHTKVETFRSRLSPKTQKELANQITALAVSQGFAKADDMDIDSTVQSANMAYPADACLLTKLGGIAHKVSLFLNKSVGKFKKSPLRVDLKKIKQKARAYFFRKKNADQTLKDKLLGQLLNTTAAEIRATVQACETLTARTLKKAKWNELRALKQLRQHAKQYLKDVRYFLKHGVMATGKALSFHLNEVTCFCKGKLGKRYEFGRAFQLARLTGNFLIVSQCTSVTMPDKKTLLNVICEHQSLFQNQALNSVATDKGYYSHRNLNCLIEHGVKQIGIQRPDNSTKPHHQGLSLDEQTVLNNRRAGIEPLIGHAKHKGQLGRSRMKSDKTTESSGYSAILGFNLRQLIRHSLGKYAQAG